MPDCLYDYDMNKNTGHQFIRAIMTQKYHLNMVKFISVKYMETFVQIPNNNDVPASFVPIG